MDPSSRSGRSSLTARLLLGLVVLVLGVATMPSEQYIGDPMAIRIVTWSLLERGRLDVPADLATTAGERGQYFVQNPRNGRHYSKYGELNTLGYVPAMLAERAILGGLDPVNNLSTRTALLNVTNLLLSLVLALLLYELAVLYVESPALALLWVLSTLYATFGWNYLRAQTAELLQWTLYTGFFLALVHLWRSRGGTRPLAAAQVLLLLLCLSKLVFVLLMPLLAGVALLAALPEQPGRSCAGRMADLLRTRPGWLLGGLAAPLALTAVVVLALNALKFGSPFVTGYTQWTRERDLFQGDLWAGLRGFLVDPQRSVFLHDPLLVPALAALPAFARRRPVEAAAAWLPLLAFLLLHARTMNWAGHWSYGPRYLLPVLAPATLPALLGLEWLRARWRTLPGAALSTALALGLAISLWLQVQVNALGFFTYYQVEAAVRAFPAPRAMATLQGTPFGLLNAQLRTFARDGSFPRFLQVASTELPPGQTSALATAVRQRVRGNQALLPGP